MALCGLGAGLLIAIGRLDRQLPAPFVAVDPKGSQIALIPGPGERPGQLQIETCVLSRRPLTIDGRRRRALPASDAGRDEEPAWWRSSRGLSLPRADFILIDDAGRVEPLVCGGVPTRFLELLARWRPEESSLAAWFRRRDVAACLGPATDRIHEFWTAPGAGR